MKDEDKTREQLISELNELRKWVAELQMSEAQLKKIEEELRKSEERYRTLFENAPDVIYSVSTEDGTLTSLNPAFERFTGWSRDEWLGKPFIELIRPDDWGIVAETYDPVLQGSRPPVYELHVRAKSGEYDVGEFTSMPRFENGKVVEEFGAVRVITERRRAEEALASERENLAVTLRSIGDGVITVNTERKIILINKVAEELTGWKSEDAIRKRFEEVFNIINEKTRKRCGNPVRKVLKTGEIFETVSGVVLISKNGTERIISDSSAPIRDKDSKVRGAVIVFRDITEKRKLEAEFLKADKLESVGILAGGIAHDFNNILFGILGNISLAKKAKTDDKLNVRLERIEKAALRAKGLTQQLLTFAKGGVPIMKTSSITELLRESADFVLRGSNVKYNIDIPDDLMPVEVDEGQLNQVINNMIINADQAMPEGGMINVSAENVHIVMADFLPLKPGRYVKISIADQGVGIPEENLKKIFDPFFTTKPKGSGLGLASSYSIIKNHNGYIHVQSSVGIGTKFSIYLPASSKKALKASQEEQKPALEHGRVLVMDDEESVRELTSDILNDLGYEPTSAENGAEAIELYKKSKILGNPYDAIILDLTIPGKMGGKETIKHLLEIDPEVRVIVSSGFSSDPVMADYRKYGFTGVIAKPYSLDEIRETVNRVLVAR